MAKRKFTPEQERAIQAEYVEGSTAAAIAIKYGVRDATILRVLKRGVDQTPAAIIPAARFMCRRIRIPKTSERSAQEVFCKLLYKVDPRATSGFGWEGILFRPGREIDESMLWPTQRYPKVPILLEYAGRQRTMRTARARDPEAREHLWIIWQYIDDAWKKVISALATASEWTYELGPIAVSLLAAANGHAGVEVLPSLDAKAGRIRDEFSELEPRDRARLAATVYGWLAAQLVAVDVDQKEIYDKAFDSAATTISETFRPQNDPPRKG